VNQLHPMKAKVSIKATIDLSDALAKVIRDRHADRLAGRRPRASHLVQPSGALMAQITVPDNSAPEAQGEPQ
jgi:hypothetical protein